MPHRKFADTWNVHAAARSSCDFELPELQPSYRCLPAINDTIKTADVADRLAVARQR
jgi:hypothetical protein